MRALSVAARAAAAAGVIVLGASCRPDRLTAPGTEGADGSLPINLGSTSSAIQIRIQPDSFEVLQGQSTKPLYVSTADGAPLYRATVWTVADSSIVRVSRDGQVTGVRGGTTNVVVTAGSLTATARAFVRAAVQRVVTTPESGELTVGQQSQLGAAVLDVNGDPMSAPVAWTSSNEAVATVSSSGLVSGVATGDAVVIATASGKSDTTRVHVSVVSVASVSVAPSSLALAVGAHALLTPSASSATGAPLAGRLATWTSSNESVARVSASGEVSAVAPGTATVTATIDGKSAVASVTVAQAGVASVTVAANATSLLVAQTTQVSATARDAAGSVISGRVVAWSSSNAQVATVSSEGVVTAVGAGTVTITGTSEGVQGSVTITVSQIAVASVRVTLNATSIVVGQTTQATAAAFDAAGQPLSGRAVTWSASPASVATVTSGGVVSGVAAGSATLTATVEGKIATAAVTVTAPATPTQPAPVSPVSVLPELPRATVSTAESATPSNGAVVRLAAGGDLQAAIDAARPGDLILLAPGASFTGNFLLRAKSGASSSAWITIRTDGALPAVGTRMTPATATSLARILTPNASPAIETEPSASYYRISGVEIAPAPSSSLAYSLVSLGQSSVAQSTLAVVPHHLVLDRLYVHGGATYNLRRCVALNSAWTAIADSWLADCHSNDGDSQAIWGSNGPGPFTIVNNHLEGAGENIMFGGDDSRSVDLLPSDITITRNHIIKPASWQNVWTTKNLFELKVGKRVLLEGNMLEGAWVSAQVGFAILVKSVNQSGGAPWSQTTDVTIRYNKLSRSAAGFSIAGRPEAFPVASTTTRVLIEQNLVEPLGSSALGGTGRLFQVNSEPADVVIRHNTGFGTNAAFIFADGTTTGFVFRDNVASGNEYNWSFSSADGHGVGVAALDYHAPGWKVDGNLFIWGGVATRPPNNLFAATMGEVGFVDAGGPLWTSFTPGDYRLTSSSPYRGKATDGTDPGVDHARLASALQGVVVQ